MSTKIIWHGTASVELISDCGRILFDPFVPLKGSTVPVKLEDFDGFTDVFITHGHFDHIVSLPAIVKRNPGTLIHYTKTPYRTLMRKGVDRKNPGNVSTRRIILSGSSVLRNMSHASRSVDTSPF